MENPQASVAATSEGRSAPLIAESSRTLPAKDSVIMAENPLPADTAHAPGDVPLPEEPPKFTRDLRAGFIRKVYLIVGAQLGLTFLIALIAFVFPAFTTFQMVNLWLMILAFLLMVGSAYALGCSKQLARTYPINFVLLLLFTLGQSYVV